MFLLFNFLINSCCLKSHRVFRAQVANASADGAASLSAADAHRRNLPGNQAWYRQPANVAQAEATLRLQFAVFQLESPSGSYVKFAHMELIAEYYDIEDIASPSGLSRNLSDSSPQADRSGAPAGIQRADDAECHSSTSNTTQECGHLPRPSISVR